MLMRLQKQHLTSNIVCLLPQFRTHLGYLFWYFLRHTVALLVWDVLAHLVGDLLGDLVGDLDALLLRHVLALLVRHLDGNLVAVGLGHVMALLCTQSSQDECIGTGYQVKRCWKRKVESPVNKSIFS